MKFRFILFSLIAFSLVFVSCGNPSNQTITNVGGEKISLDYFLATQQYTGYASTSVSRQVSILEDFYRVMLRAHDARQIDFPEKKWTRWRAFLNRRQVILDNIYEKEVTEFIVPDEMVRTAYERSHERRLTRQILLTYQGATNSTNNRSQSEALELIRNIRSRIESGDLTFEEAAREYSDDASAGYGGNLGYIDWGTMVQPFQETVWQLEPNTLSEPVETRYGYHLVEVTDIDTVDIGTYDSEYYRLRERLLNANRGSVSSREDELYNTIMQETNYILYDSVLSQFTYEVLQYANTEINLEDTDITTVFDEIEYQPIGEIYGEPISRQEFENFLLTLQYVNPGALSDFNSFVEAITGYFQQNVFIKYGERQGIYQHKNVEEKLRYRVDQTYSQSYINNVVLKDFPPPEDTLRAFYDRTKYELYSDSTRLRVREIYVTSRDTADMLYQRIESGADFAELAADYSLRESAVVNEGDLGWITPHRFGPIGQEALSMEAGEISEPLQVGTGWSIIQLTEKTTPALPPFEEISTQVRRDYSEQYRPRIIEQNIRQLEDKYDCSLNYEILDQI